MVDAFYSEDPKASKKERKRLSQKDRSQFKKTDRSLQNNKIKKRDALIKKSHPDLLHGRVLSLSSEYILVRADDGRDFHCKLKGTLKQQIHRAKNLIAVGDFVQFYHSNEQEGIIALIEERKSILSRTSPKGGAKEQLIAVNIDQVLITSSVILPPLKSHLIDRYIIAALKGNMDPVIVINKCELLKMAPKDSDPSLVRDQNARFEEIMKIYHDLRFPIVAVSAVTGEGLDRLKALMEGKASVFSGQSGVGKTSLINKMLGTKFDVGDVVSKTKKGSHTTSHAQLIPVGEHGFCIDTPGIKSFGIWDLKPEDVRSYFFEFEPFSDQCPYRDCNHLKEPKCGVKEAVEQNKISRLRFESYCALMSELEEEDLRR